MLGGSLLPGAYDRRMDKRRPSTEDRDERVALPLDPELALRALLRVDPDAPPAVPNGSQDDNEAPTE